MQGRNKEHVNFSLISSDVYHHARSEYFFFLQNYARELIDNCVFQNDRYENYCHEKSILN